MKFKKIMTFLLTGAMVFSVPFFAGLGDSSVLVAYAEGDDDESTDEDDGDDGDEDDKEEDSTGGTSTSGSTSSSGSSSSSSATPTRDPAPSRSQEEIDAERIANEIAAQEAREAAREAAQVAQESAAYASVVDAAGVSAEIYTQAIGENKSVGEYMNNAVTQVPGLTNTTPVGQGGQVIIDGVVTNNTFSVQKPLLAHVRSAQSAGLGGTIMNVVDIKGTASFDTATVNFYMPGVTAEQDIQVYQLSDGTWNSVTVSEVREDHVVIDMNSYGVFAFVDVPVQ